MRHTYTYKEVKSALDTAQAYADKHSGCQKVAVGSLLIPAAVRDAEFHCDGNMTMIAGSNVTYPVDCRRCGCRRIQLYGEDSKNHRLPSDCRSLHSEVDAITKAAQQGISTKDATMFVTRYPCEACARAIVSAGISEVFYGRKQDISDETKAIFDTAKVLCIHVATWDHADTER